MIGHTPAGRPASLSRRRVLATAGAATLAPVLTPALVACSGGEAPTQVRGPLDQVVYLTSFGAFGRDAYPFVAAEKGYFADANLDVEVQPGRGIRNLEHLAAGTAHFGAVDMSAFMVTVAQGNTAYTAVAAIHQLASAAVMTTDPDISAPHDLAGKTVAMFSGGTVELLFPAYAAQVALDDSDVHIVNGNPQQLPALLGGGTVDAIEQFAMGLPSIQAAVGDRAVTVLPYSDVLTDLYGVVIVTTSELAEQQPDLCSRFLDALLRGLDYSLNNPPEAGEILARIHEEQPPEVAAAELEIMGSYSRVTGVPLGGIDEIRVAQSIALLEAIGAIGAVPGGLRAEQFVSFDLVPQGDPG